MTGFILIFKDNLSETSIVTTNRHSPFKISSHAIGAYEEIPQKKFVKRIIELISSELVKY